MPHSNGNYQNQHASYLRRVFPKLYVFYLLCDPSKAMCVANQTYSLKSDVFIEKIRELEIICLPRFWLPEIKQLSQTDRLRKQASDRVKGNLMKHLLNMFIQTPFLSKNLLLEYQKKIHMDPLRRAVSVDLVRLEYETHTFADKQ